MRENVNIPVFFVFFVLSLPLSLHEYTYLYIYIPPAAFLEFIDYSPKTALIHFSTAFSSKKKKGQERNT